MISEGGLPAHVPLLHDFAREIGIADPGPSAAVAPRSRAGNVFRRVVFCQGCSSTVAFVQAVSFMYPKGTLSLESPRINAQKQAEPRSDIAASGASARAALPCDYIYCKARKSPSNM